MDWPKFHSQLPAALKEAQEAHELAVEGFGIAADLEADARADYQLAKADAIKKLLSNGEKVSVIDKLADGMCAESNRAYLKAKGRKEKISHLIEAIKERSYNLRHMGKDGDARIRGAV